MKTAQSRHQTEESVKPCDLSRQKWHTGIFPSEPARSSGLGEQALLQKCYTLPCAPWLDQTVRE